MAGLSAGEFKYGDALTVLLTTESIVFAAFGIAIGMLSPAGRVRRWVLPPTLLLSLAVGAIAAIGVGAGVAWSEVFLGAIHGWTQDTIAWTIFLAIAVEPVLAALLALATRFPKLMGVRIPLHLRKTGRTYACRRWVDRHCLKDIYFQSIHDYMKIWQRHHDEIEPTDATWQAIAPSVAMLLHDDGDFLNYIDDKVESANLAAERDSDWEQICIATGLILIERFLEAFEKQEWTPNG